MDIIKGDILDVKSGIVVHQVNTLGVMGAGLALQVKKKFPGSYDTYKNIVEQHKKSADSLMGQTFLTREGESLCIAHLFAQSSIGAGTLRTDYKSFEEGLIDLKNNIFYFKLFDLPVYFPYKIGCGLGGGDWRNVVKPLIKEHFPEATIVRYQ